MAAVHLYCVCGCRPCSETEGWGLGKLVYILRTDFVSEPTRVRLKFLRERGDPVLSHLTGLSKCYPQGNSSYSRVSTLDNSKSLNCNFRLIRSDVPVTCNSIEEMAL